MKTAKFYGEVYEVKPTGVTRIIPAKSFYDFNGYWTETKPQVIEQIGLYDSEGKLCFTLGRDGKSVFNGCGKSIGGEIFY